MPSFMPVMLHLSISTLCTFFQARAKVVSSRKDANRAAQKVSPEAGVPLGTAWEKVSGALEQYLWLACAKPLIHNSSSGCRRGVGVLFMLSHWLHSGSEMVMGCLIVRKSGQNMGKTYNLYQTSSGSSADHFY